MAAIGKENRWTTETKVLGNIPPESSASLDEPREKTKKIARERISGFDLGIVGHLLGV